MKLADVARYVNGNDPISFIPVISNYGVLASREWKFSQETGLFGIFNMIRSVFCYRDHRSERYLINLVEHLE
jgi:hypothetical protein